MRTLLLLMFMLLPLSATAVIYKSVDSDGNVIYGDEPSLNAEEIPEPSPNTVQMPKPKPVAPLDPAEAGRYTRLVITQPAANAPVHSNLGLVTISLQLAPKLDTKAGHTINILVDGYVLVRSSTRLNAQIPDISHGNHRLQAIVANKEGITLIKSDEVVFFMQNQPQAEKSDGAQPGPKDASGNAISPGPTGTFFKPGPAPP